MLFNSIGFLVFLPVVFLLYWFLFPKNLKLQNAFVLLSSYYFYGVWDARFLLLIALSTIVDYFVALQLDKEPNVAKRKAWLGLSIGFNLGVLGFFKYYNFFVDSWIEMLAHLGIQVVDPWTLEVVLPVGISFYTFQTMSYTIDVYRRKLTPTRDLLAFASFVAFFPQLVAGPIERASHLLPQMLQKRSFDYAQAVSGVKLIVWGMFKKVVVADSLAVHVNQVFSNPEAHGVADHWLGAIFFAFQIYGDFSGYSDIAIGTSKLFGFDLMSNFKFPYFSRNIAEFWRKWHISLSTWFRDYLYIPLGGSAGSRWLAMRNIFIIFTVSGFWHGANWTFIVWGVVHALLYVPSFVFKTNRNYVQSYLAENSRLPSLQELSKVLLTFASVTLAWVFFRSESVGAALEYLNGMFGGGSGAPTTLRGLVDLGPFIIMEYLFRRDERNPLNTSFKWLNRLLILYVLLEISANFLGGGSDFIYFQF